MAGKNVNSFTAHENLTRYSSLDKRVSSSKSLTVHEIIDPKILGFEGFSPSNDSMELFLKNVQEVNMLWFRHECLKDGDEIRIGDFGKNSIRKFWPMV